MICSFFGHRTINQDFDRKKLLDLLVDLIQNKNVNDFYFGGFGDFDKLCYDTISKLKTYFPSIKRIYCVENEKYLLSQKRIKYLPKEEYEDYVSLPLSFYGWYKRIYFRNCAMIDNSDFIIFYAQKRENSGAYKAFLYAKKNKKICYNIYP